jgi:DNA-binding PucR family transcriptional regulator
VDVGFSGSWKFARFTKNQHPVTEAPKNTLVNLSDQKLEDGTLSLQKGLNHAVAPRATPLEEILVGIEKAVRSLPVEKAEEARQESVRIIKTTTRNKDNLTKNERMALRTLKDNTHLTILPAHKGNATVILNTTDYKLKIVSLLEDSAKPRHGYKYHASSHYPLDFAAP